MGSKQMNISFIMPAYNYANIIVESVESIIHGNFEHGDELIIVNDCSTDNTDDVLNNLKNQYPFLKIISHKYNKGSAAAGRNSGIEQSRNELIFCLDADNVLCPNTVQKLKEYLIIKNAEVAAFGELHYFANNKENVTHRWIFNEEIELADCFVGYYNPCGSGNYLFTKKSWLKAGRYNESIGGAFDSLAFGVCQLAIGSKMVTIPNLFYYHRYQHESTFVRDEKKLPPSLRILQILLPYIHLFNDRDIEYIMSRDGRYTWFENLGKHPIRLKSGEVGRNGNVVYINDNSLQNNQPCESSLRGKMISPISRILSNTIKYISRK